MPRLTCKLFPSTSKSHHRFEDLHQASQDGHRVSARALHHLMGLRMPYPKWIDSRLKSFSWFKLDDDFVVARSIDGDGREEIDHLLSDSAASFLAFHQRGVGDRGRQIYWILDDRREQASDTLALKRLNDQLNKCNDLQAQNIDMLLAALEQERAERADEAKVILGGVHMLHLKLLSSDGLPN
jgi:phage anti-repressor protein